LQPFKEAPISLFKSKSQKRDPSAFALRMTRKRKFIKILESQKDKKEILRFSASG